MCREIQVNGQWCENIGQFRRALGAEPVIILDMYRGVTVDDDTCLCPVDVPATAERHGLRHTVGDDGFETLTGGRR